MVNLELRNITTLGLRSFAFSYKLWTILSISSKNLLNSEMIWGSTYDVFLFRKKLLLFLSTRRVRGWLPLSNKCLRNSKLGFSLYQSLFTSISCLSLFLGWNPTWSQPKARVFTRPLSPFRALDYSFCLAIPGWETTESSFHLISFSVLLLFLESTVIFRIKCL